MIVKIKLHMEAVDSLGYRVVAEFSNDWESMRGPVEAEALCAARIESIGEALALSVMRAIQGGDDSTLTIRRGKSHQENADARCL